MKVSDLTANPKNPRKISDTQLKNLKKSLDTFGDLSGIVFNRNTKRLVGAHQRVKCLPKDIVINITKKYDTPTKTGTVALGHVKILDDLFTYREVLWDEPTELAANIAANKHGGEFDLTILPDIISDIDAANIDLDLTGFDEKELEDLMAPVWSEASEKDDEVPEIKESFVKEGDLWILGNHRLLCGDSTNIQHVEKLMNGEKADMVFTDPPYGINAISSSGVLSSRYNQYENEGNDKCALNFIKQCLDRNNKIIVFGGNYFAHALPKSTHWIIWDKRGSEMEGGNKNGDQSDCEIAWTNLNKKNVKTYKHVWAGWFREGNKKDELNSKIHPSQKPVGLFEKIFADYDFQTCFDGFGGSGSTLIACEKTNRKCFMMEIDPHYCGVIIKRWQKYTGKKAQLENKL